MNQAVLVSIVINNYNYGRYVADAIDSALNQTHRLTEVIVVDDGSTDESREIITAYEDAVVTVFKENGGQASALNAGFAVSRGQIIIFLDADDILLATAAEEVLPCFQCPNVVKVHWALFVINEYGSRTGELIPGGPLAEGNYRDIVLKNGPTSYVSPPTSGNAWARAFLEKVCPIPEAEYRIGADTYLFELAPVFGEMKRISKPQGYYRRHGQNRYSSLTFPEQLAHGLRFYDNYSAVLARHCIDSGYDVATAEWRLNSWWHQVERIIQATRNLVPEEHAFILVNHGEWDASEVLGHRQAVPFLGRNGRYWGPPADDAIAIEAFESLRSAHDATHIVFCWPHLWWLQHYRRFYEYLQFRHACVRNDDLIVALDLRAGQAGS